MDDEHKFAAVLLALPMPTATIFKTQLDNPPFLRKYEFAKDLIVRHFSRNEFDRIKSLTDAMELGDAKPSELYANMSQIAGEVVSPATLKGLWIMRLPVQWRSSLALTSDEPLDFLRAADLMYEVTPRSSITAISDNTQPEQLNFVAKRNYAKKDQTASHSRTDDSSQFQSDDVRLCFFHAKFGARARKCRAPCGWKYKDASQDK